MPSYIEKFDYDLDADNLSECYGIHVNAKNKKTGRGLLPPVVEMTLKKKSESILIER